VVQQYEYSTGLSKGLCRMCEHLCCQAHGTRGHIGHCDDAVIEFTHEVRVQPHAMQREVLRHPMHGQDIIALQLDIFELLKRDPQGLCLCWMMMFGRLNYVGLGSSCRTWGCDEMYICETYV
jgi:hypothetical protein